MSSLTPAPSKSTWVERAIPSDALPLPAYLAEVSAGIFAPVTTGAHDACQVDVDNNSVYKPLDINDRVYLISDGAGGLTGSATGTEYAILVADTNGVLYPTTDLTQDATAEAYADGNGRYITTGIGGGDGLQLIAMSSNIQPFI